MDITFIRFVLGDSLQKMYQAEIRPTLRQAQGERIKVYNYPLFRSW